MSASMAEVIAEHSVKVESEEGFGESYYAARCYECGLLEGEPTEAEHQAEILAEAGFGKLEDAWDEGYAAGKRVMVQLMSPTHFATEADNPYKATE